MDEAPIAGGELVVPGFGIYWPMRKNQLFFFSNLEMHGTAELDLGDATHSRYMLTCSAPRLLWRKLSAQGRPDVAGDEH